VRVQRPVDERIAVEVDLGPAARGFLVVDTTVDDRSHGGLRVAEDLTLREVSALAREMTLKFSFSGRRSGGAKSGLRIPPGTSVDEKRRLLGEFGRHLGPVVRRGLYQPGADINCGPEDLRAFYAGAGLGHGSSTDTAFFTAVFAFDALEACRESLGAARRPLRVGVEGFGAAAAWLAQRMAPEHYAVTALSTIGGAVVNERGFSLGALAEARRRFGDELLVHVDGERGGREAVFDAPVDVFIPSARTWSLTAERAKRLSARWVVPLANAPYDADSVRRLEERGIACLPGYVVNCGGVFGSDLFDGGVPLRDVEHLSAHRFRPVVRALLEARSRTGVSAVEIAEEVALQRLAARQAGTVRRSGLARRVDEFWRGLIPMRVRGRATLEAHALDLEGLRELVESWVRRPSGSREEERPGSDGGSVGDLGGPAWT